jgi:hypothetical protein
LPCMTPPLSQHYAAPGGAGQETPGTLLPSSPTCGPPDAACRAIASACDAPHRTGAACRAKLSPASARKAPRACGQGPCDAAQAQRPTISSAGPKAHSRSHPKRAARVSGSVDESTARSTGTGADAAQRVASGILILFRIGYCAVMRRTGRRTPSPAGPPLARHRRNLPPLSRHKAGLSPGCAGRRGDRWR